MAEFFEEEKQEEKVVQIRRVTKVVKGGKKMGFRAAVVIGNRKGKVGLGIGKSNEVSSAIRKAVERAKKELIVVPIKNATIPHSVFFKMGASRIVIRPAPRVWVHGPEQLDHLGLPRPPEIER